jgi:prepilin-type N-terminal cleavage/methylation domain-containing protein
MARGYTLIELLLVCAILLILALIFAGGFTSFRQAQALQLDSRNAASFIEKARAQTLAGQGGVPYGVHVGTSTLTLFAGSSYDPNGAGNETLAFDSGVAVVQTSLAGNGSDIVFEQLSGDTQEYGSITLSVGSSQRTVTVSSAGIVNVP